MNKAEQEYLDYLSIESVFIRPKTVILTGGISISLFRFFGPTKAWTFTDRPKKQLRFGRWLAKGISSKGISARSCQRRCRPSEDFTPIASSATI
jgi:hypothetical protein